MPLWSPTLSLQAMDRNSISCAILSLSAPALTFVQDRTEAASLARRINTYAASLRETYPGRFGFFSTLPSLDDIRACSNEIEYAFDSLDADGIALLSSYNEKYLGHPDFGPLWALLDKRHAVVLVHPVQGPAPALVEPAMPPPMFDIPHETTKAAVSMVIGNVIRDYPNVKILLSHAGGTLPFVARGAAHQLGGTPSIGHRSSTEFLGQAKRFYYDLALSAYDGPVDLLRKFVGIGHITYGSDFPFASPDSIKSQADCVKAYTNELDRTTGEENWKGEGWDVRKGNALRLFPKMAARIERAASSQQTNGT